MPVGIDWFAAYPGTPHRIAAFGVAYPNLESARLGIASLRSVPMIITAAGRRDEAFGTLREKLKRTGTLAVSQGPQRSNGRRAATLRAAMGIHST